MREYRNILVYALVNLGDVLLTTSATSLLRQAYPSARITMMVRPAVRQAVENNPVIDEVLILDYKPKENSFGVMRRMVKELRRRNFDLAVSYDRKSRPALLCWLAGIPERIGPDMVFEAKKSRVPWLYTRTIHIEHDLDDTLQAETYQTIVRGITGGGAHAHPVMARITEDDERAAEALLSRLPRAGKRIGLCVKGTFSLKTWPKEYFAEVVRRLAERYDAAFFIVGAPGDRAYSEEVIEAMAPVKAENFCGETSLTSLAALIGRADLFVTVDTGATHIAATTGVPMVVMYGCTSPRRWHPYNANARVLTTNEACCPCHVREADCPTAPRPACLWKITPGQVLGECAALLEEKDA